MYLFWFRATKFRYTPGGNALFLPFNSWKVSLLHRNGRNTGNDVVCISCHKLELLSEMKPDWCFCKLVWKWLGLMRIQVRKVNAERKVSSSVWKVWILSESLSDIPWMSNHFLLVSLACKSPGRHKWYRWKKNSIAEASQVQRRVVMATTVTKSIVFAFRGRMSEMMAVRDVG